MIDYGDGPHAWMAHIACRDEDPDIFFPADKSRLVLVQARRAALICKQCPVQAPCREHKKRTGAHCGIWGEEFTTTKGIHYGKGKHSE